MSDEHVQDVPVRSRSAVPAYERLKMKMTFLAAIMAVGLLAPIGVLAEPTQSAISRSDNKTEQIFVIRPTQLLVIGAGIVIGAVAGEALLTTDLGYLVGGIVGGYISNFWYDGQQLELHIATPPKS